MANLTTLVSIIAAQTGSTKKDTDVVVRQVFATIAEQLAAEGEVTIPGFGAFRVKDVEARTGRNPQTGEEIQIAATKKLSFKASKVLKETIKG